MAVVVILTFLTVFILMLVLYRAVALPKIVVAERVSHLAASKVNRVKQRPNERIKSSQKSRKALLLRLETTLKHADIKMNVREYLTRWIASAFCIAFAAVLVSGIAAAIVALGGYWFGTLMYLRARQRQRRRKFEHGLHDMLTIVANSMRAGHSFTQALHIVAEETSGPLQEELQRIGQEMQIGVGLDEALARSNERVGSEDFDLIVTAISIQRQIGGNLAEVLDKITETIRERVTLQREVKALTSQGRLSAGIFMLLPVGVGVMLFMVNPSYMKVMFESTIGLLLLVVAGVSQLFGYILIRKIVRVEL